jgi:AbrB family looped-hinge helix DNA binding protein
MGAKKISKLTEKYQATIPKEIRQVLKLKKGDSVLYEVNRNGVTLKKATPQDHDWLSGLESQLSEWNTENDDEAYGDL